MARRLEGKVALVTGAARGIGAGIAAAFREAGAAVYAADLGEPEGGDDRSLRLDVRREDHWQAAERLIREHEGRLDILVNNAGVELVRPLPELSLEDWRHVMAVNVDGVFLGCRTLQGLMAATGSATSTASIVNISSIAGIVGYPDQAAYNTSKGAVRHLTKSLAIEFASHGQPIRVNSIHPGCIRTPMLEEAVAGWTKQGLLNRDDPWKDVGAMCQIGRASCRERV